MLCPVPDVLDLGRPAVRELLLYASGPLDSIRCLIPVLQHNVLTLRGKDRSLRSRNLGLGERTRVRATYLTAACADTADKPRVAEAQLRAGVGRGLRGERRTLLNTLANKEVRLVKHQRNTATEN
jgi:hypothetical protein